jgi:hypothetical protein
MLTNLRHRLPWFALLGVLTVAMTACNSDGGGDSPPVAIVNIGGGDAGVDGCVQPSFPADQPDLSSLPMNWPRFVTDNENGQATGKPGATLEAEITVNAQTRQAFVELKDVWSDSPAFASAVIDTPGNEKLEVLFFTDPNQRFGRYYMKITLCGSDCDDGEVVFDINPDINSPYERTVFEDGEPVPVQVDSTCVKPFPQGTIVIQ